MKYKIHNDHVYLFKEGCTYDGYLTFLQNNGMLLSEFFVIKEGKETFKELMSKKSVVVFTPKFLNNNNIFFCDSVTMSIEYFEKHFEIV